MMLSVLVLNDDNEVSFNELRMTRELPLPTLPVNNFVLHSLPLNDSNSI